MWSEGPEIEWSGLSSEAFDIHFGNYGDELRFESKHTVFMILVQAKD